MEGPLWWEARSALADIAGMAALYDVDGVDLYFVNDKTEGSNLRVRLDISHPLPCD